MGTAWGTALHSQANKRLSYTIPEQTTAIPAKLSQKSNSSLERDDGSDQQNAIPGCIKIGGTLPQFRFNDILETQRRRHAEANFQSEKLELVCTHRKIPSDKHPPGARLSASPRLVDEDRSAPGLFSPTSLAQSSLLFAVNLPRQANGDDVPTIRAQFSPEDFCILNELDCTTPEGSRGTSSSVPRRLAHSTPRSHHSKETCHVNCEPTSSSRVECQQREKCFLTEKNCRILGRCLGHLEQHKAPPREVGFQNREASIESDGVRQGQPGSVAAADRPVKFCQLCCPERASTLSSFTSESERTLTRQNSKTLTTATQCTQRTPMVASALQKELNDSFTIPNSLLDHGCERYRMGSQTGLRQLNGRLGSYRAEPSLQSQRNDRHPQRLARSLSAPELKGYPYSVRQQNCCVISPQRGRNQVCFPNRSYLSDFSNPRSQQHTHDHLSHSRELQRPRRPPLSQTEPARVAPSPSIDEGSLREMGCSTHRPVCVPQCPRGRYLLHARQDRQASGLLRCAGESVELSASLGVPTTLSDPENAGTPKQRSRNLPDRSTTVGEGLLEARSEEQSSGPTIYNQRSPSSIIGRDDRPTTTESVGNDFRNLEMWGWNRHLGDWTEEQKTLLSSGWRKSTLNTYRPAWNRWKAWADNNNVDTYSPNGSQLARFLADIHQKDGLSLSTILVHKSVISTFCDPNENQKLSSHTLVRQVLKSIALAKPKSKTKLPVWDIDTLSEHLSKKDPNTSSFYEASRHTAALLLLCSGRRVHDLTLLKASTEHCTIASDNIVLWPAFGSKTDSATHRQSGWKLLVNNNKALDPVHWINRLIELSQPRRLLAKSDNLFLTTIGKPRPASRTVIGGWVKKLLQEAGIEATPGSFRSAVASKNWIENFPLDDILAKGNWKSAKTFQKYYRREIISESRSNLSSHFVPTQ